MKTVAVMALEDGMQLAEDIVVEVERFGSLCLRRFVRPESPDRALTPSLSAWLRRTSCLFVASWFRIVIAPIL